MVEAVAALEKRDHATVAEVFCQQFCRARHRAKAFRRHAHASVRVGGGGVLARRDQNEVRAEAPHRRLDDLLERVPVPVVARARRQRNVHCRAVAPLLEHAGTLRIQIVLVERHEEHRRVCVEDLLRPVAVMDVPVDDRDAASYMTRGDRDRVEETEAHRLLRRRVVARGAAAHERVLEPARDDTVDRFQ